MNTESTYTGAYVMAQFLADGDIVNGHAVVDFVDYNDDDETVTVHYTSTLHGEGYWILPDEHKCFVTGIGD
jgi:hypothetical protein